MALDAVGTNCPVALTLPEAWMFCEPTLLLAMYSEVLNSERPKSTCRAPLCTATASMAVCASL
ncbi:hypothetical protein D3C86_2195360 [compost metagenome]